jgi:hypothetical protein
MAGYAWLASFLEQNPEVSFRQAEGLPLSRAQGLKKEGVHKLFKILEACLNKDTHNTHNRLIFTSFPRVITSFLLVRTTLGILFGTAERTLTCILQMALGKKKTPWPLVRKRTIPTERPPLVGEVSANFCG